jgi:serine O-acetyltransferase
MKFKLLIFSIYNDLKTYSGNKNSIVMKFVIFFTSTGFQLLANYRISNYLKDTPFFFLNIFIRYLNNLVMSSDISPYAKLGTNIRFVHPSGIIIGYGTIIGDNVTIFQQVTLGAQGGIQTGNKKYPIIGNGVKIYTKASVIGSVIIGNNCIIGAHSLVIKDAEQNSIYVGIPAKKVSNV